MKSTKITSMKFGQPNQTTDKSSHMNQFGQIHGKTDFKPDERNLEVDPLQTNQLKSKNKTQKKQTKGNKKSEKKGVPPIRASGSLLTGETKELLSGAELEVKQELLEMQDQDDRSEFGLE